MATPRPTVLIRRDRSPPRPSQTSAVRQADTDQEQIQMIATAIGTPRPSAPKIAGTNSESKLNGFAPSSSTDRCKLCASTTRSCASCPADPETGPRRAAGPRRAVLARATHAGGRAAPDRVFARGGGAARHRRGGHRIAGVRAGLRRQRAARRHAAVRGQLRRPPVRPLGRAARRRPRDHAGRNDQRRTASAGSCSSRARARRRIRAAPTAARCCARRSANSCAARRCTTSACRPRAR